MCPKTNFACAAPMSAYLAKNDECCPTYECKCPPLKDCPPSPAPTCRPGFIAKSVADECGCLKYEVDCVVPENKCKFTMASGEVKIYEIGQTWKVPGKPCESYECVAGTPATVQRQVTSCETKCALGYQYKPEIGKCCGKCVPVGCVVNGTVYKNGEAVPATEACTTATCFVDTMYGSSVSTSQIRCKNSIELPVCKKGEAQRVPGACCDHCRPAAPTKECAPCVARLVFTRAEDTVGYFRTSINGQICENKGQLADLRECSGYCSSAFKYFAVMNKYQNDCQCCQAQTTEKRVVELTCMDGSKVTREYDVPTSCGCGTCTGRR
ncbi:von Willebrand factor-like [Lingula anatina]|nr:von Willebrand factor-like [Lingula anatina]|eukprot:XP_013394049.1 von Willebrand factor-like [Lingula anatina]